MLLRTYERWGRIWMVVSMLYPRHGCKNPSSTNQEINAHKLKSKIANQCYKNHVIRRIDFSANRLTGMIYRVAGDNIASLYGDGGPVLQGRFKWPWGIALVTTGGTVAPIFSQRCVNSFCLFLWFQREASRRQVKGLLTDVRRIWYTRHHQFNS